MGFEKQFRTYDIAVNCYQSKKLNMQKKPITTALSAFDFPKHLAKANSRE